MASEPKSVKKLDLSIKPEFMESLRRDSFYSTIDIDFEAAKCERHHNVNGSNYNKRSLVKWLCNAVTWKREKEGVLNVFNPSVLHFGMTPAELKKLRAEVEQEVAKEKAQ